MDTMSRNAGSAIRNPATASARQGEHTELYHPQSTLTRPLGLAVLTCNHIVRRFSTCPFPCRTNNGAFYPLEALRETAIGTSAEKL